MAFAASTIRRMPHLLTFPALTTVSRLAIGRDGTFSYGFCSVLRLGDGFESVLRIH
jgi:hypothetical protein